MALTTERLREIAEDGFLEHGDAKLMARELLANRETQPVMWAHERKLSTDVAITKDEVVAAAWKSEGLSVIPLYTAPPAPANANAVAWEMRYWNSGHNMWGEWECITAEQHAEMSVQHATDNDYEFRVLYDAPPAPAVPDDYQHLKNVQELYHNQEDRLFSLAQRIKGAAFDKYSHTTAQAIDAFEREIFGEDGDACRAAMLAAAPEGVN
ncbi:hypothetical protein [Serratia surfactantfaciens]|uniref:Uncharacterized protein n=1 Tax=Serratia surfactantfaciens TaxID=2741499 RepID=A0ABS0LU80_9GAMM|nr:hypothetical protein [Serratia surfactantfaciens]MBH1918875.1 hypothetical protein [Serratia surfactantfaciens]